MAENYFYGLNYGINQNNCPTFEMIKSDFTKIHKSSPYLLFISANELGMYTYLSMWIDSPDTFNQEMNALKNILDNSDYQPLTNVDALIVGSEVLYRNDTDPDTLANYIHTGIQVTTADVYYTFPPVIIASRERQNGFSYWEGISTLLSQYQSVVATKANGKPVRISETGWPTASGHFGNSVASPANQKLYLSNVVCQTQSDQANWGIMYANHALKGNLSPSLFANPTCQVKHIYLYMLYI
ncbi:glycoside hydrolase superfamily [Cokeromyces recurvatus]|uniref:glycoside hydrolase superfamily n=1 Tax=Cokeromyces recurvatus TaxID=90255 RepID=UPI00221E6A1C|nr:glycoside hydrolase superfamily [Cokeromyces recurvatus]KAI7898967.1 glycoside hydrolase superfamily [Cokeromyces recurvatus]